MKFNRLEKQVNRNYNQQVQNREEALKLIAEIDKYLAYADDTTEYEQIKKHVQTFVPKKYNEVTLRDDVQQALYHKFNKLHELAESLK